MKRKLNLMQLITYLILGMTLVFSVLTFLKMKINSKFYEPDPKMSIILAIEGLDLSPEQEKEISKLFDEIDEIQKQFPSLTSERKKEMKMTKLFKKGKITEEEFNKFKKEKNERLFEQNRLYHQKYLDALNLFTEEQINECFDKLLLRSSKRHGKKAMTWKEAKRKLRGKDERK